jgi:hypothetical protein
MADLSVEIQDTFAPLRGIASVAASEAIRVGENGLCNSLLATYS